MVPHTRPLLVSGSTSWPQAEEEHGGVRVRVRPSIYEGPTAVTYLISLQAAELGVETGSYVVHLPQYFQMEEDFAGTARLTEIMCKLYNLPNRLADHAHGRRQYAELQTMVDDSSGVPPLLKQLEEQYDREEREGGTPPPPLSPSVEQFLRELDQGFETPS